MEAIRIIRVGNGLAFPDFEDGEHLQDLINAIAEALQTRALKPVGSPLEWLIHFAGLPEDVSLWWDGVTCELGTVTKDVVAVDQICEHLLASKWFTLST